MTKVTKIRTKNSEYFFNFYYFCSFLSLPLPSPHSPKHPAHIAHLVSGAGIFVADLAAG